MDDAVSSHSDLSTNIRKYTRDVTIGVRARVMLLVFEKKRDYQNELSTDREDMPFAEESFDLRQEVVNPAGPLRLGVESINKRIQTFAIQNLLSL
jgi:hypothetical protein